MDRSDAAAFLLDKDRLAYCDMIDVLRSEEGTEITFLSDDGMLIRHPCSTYMAASFSSSCSWIDPFIISVRLVVSHGHGLSDYLCSMGLKQGEPCYLFVYEGDRIGKDYSSIRPLGPEHAEMAAEAYGHEVGYIRERIDAGRLWGIFSGAELAGFGGFHSEGAMGMLEVMPEYRRHGIGEALERFLIKEALKRGHVPYCNVYISNEKSIRLQTKLGLKRGSRFSHWIRKSDLPEECTK